MQIFLCKINIVNFSLVEIAMELKWLEDLVVLLEEKSISRAAQRRHVTQPAFSRRIRQLEQWLGVELVDRSTKPIKIRATGLALEGGVRDLVNRFYALRNSVHETRERVTFVAQHTLAISTFPALTEKPVISKQLIPIQIMFINLAGDMDQKTRKSLAQQIRDELTSLPEINQAQILGDRNYEISIEISEQTLRQYGLTLNEVSSAIKKSSVDMFSFFFQ